MLYFLNHANNNDYKFESFFKKNLLTRQLRQTTVCWETLLVKKIYKSVHFINIIFTILAE